jgi:hypothetical protein
MPSLIHKEHPTPPYVPLELLQQQPLKRSAIMMMVIIYRMGDFGFVKSGVNILPLFIVL